MFNHLTAPSVGSNQSMKEENTSSIRATALYTVDAMDHFFFSFQICKTTKASLVLLTCGFAVCLFTVWTVIDVNIWSVIFIHPNAAERTEIQQFTNKKNKSHII